MSSSLRLVRNSTSALRNPQTRTPCLTQIRLASAGSHTGSKWHGRETEEHAVNRKDELDVQAQASQSGGRERASGDERQSQASTEKDSGNQNEQAKKDHPEAPGPVIGMNDERGQVGSMVRVVRLFTNYWTDGSQEMSLKCELFIRDIEKIHICTSGVCRMGTGILPESICQGGRCYVSSALHHWLHNASIKGGLDLRVNSGPAV